jgi:general secretion pathway protein D
MTRSAQTRALRILAPFGVVSALLLTSCAHPGATQEQMEFSSTASTLRFAGDPTRVNGRVSPGSGTVARPIVRQDSNGAVIAMPQPPTYASESGDISLNYVDADIREVVRLILGETLHLNYTIDPGFMGMVTIQTVQPLKRDALLPTLQGLLDQVGGTMTYQNGVFRIGIGGNDAVIPAVVGAMSPETASQVVSLRYASARQLATILEPYVGDAARVLGDPTRNVLIVTGSASARKNVIDLIHVFDVDYLAGQSYALFPVRSGDPSRMATELEAALQLEPEGPLGGAIKIVPITEANAVMVIAQQQAYLDRVSRLILQLDQVKEVGGRTIHVYFLRHAQPTDLQPILQRAVNPPNAGAIDEIAPGNLPPTATPAQVSGPAAAATAPAAGQPTPAMAIPTSATAPSASGGQPLPEAPPVEDLSQAAGANARGPQIIADRNNSALVVVATESEYAVIEAAIRKLDVMPMQVLIEATVAEVTLNNDLQYGTQFFLNSAEGRAILSNAVSASPTLINPASSITNAQLFPGTLAPAFPGFAVVRAIGEQQFAIQALKTITDVQIISAPKLLILDKQPARLQVGDLVPTITQSATSVITSDAPVVNSIQYQATGVILTVTPRINAGGLVTLDIEQEVSDVVPTTSSDINSPTFQQRRIQTKVVVQDGETISLGGLISDKNFRGNSGIPVLQDIPVLGALFSTRTNTDLRTELLILLTPRVVNDQSDARALTEELRRRLAPALQVQ